MVHSAEGNPFRETKDVGSIKARGLNVTFLG
jgi:hypothetical protein